VLYLVLRAIAGISLRWFYARVDVVGRERIPQTSPVLLAVNHPNALVDALVVGWICPRRIVLTARATLFTNRAFAWFLRTVGVVPLIRAKDVTELGVRRDAVRNVDAFNALNATLARGRAVLIFPEGVTGDRPSLAPIRTGAARLALQARDAGVSGLVVLPIGLTFERKDIPRTRVVVHVGEPIAVDDLPSQDANAVAALTSRIEDGLRAVTLNFATVEEAASASDLASTLAKVFRGASGAPVSRPVVPYTEEFAIARRIEALRTQLAGAPHALVQRADGLLARLDDVGDTLAQHGIALEDVEIETAAGPGARLVVRESPLILIGAPFALWGWVNHVLPFNLSRMIATRSPESAADPAMNTIIAGIILVLLFYGAQGAVVWWLFGATAAVLYWVSLPVAAEVNFHLQARLQRIVRRARAYLLFRRDPAVQAALRRDIGWVRDEATAIADAAVRRSSPTGVRD
jgi:glycerol-3-phosphate O-acyltransferase / dihydroxyacetone phosphate acyltransferase